jgi:hypothetical protein
MEWTRILAYITGSVDQELLLRNESLFAENRILRAKMNRRQQFSDAERATLRPPGRNSSGPYLYRKFKPGRIDDLVRPRLVRGVRDLSSEYHVEVVRPFFSERCVRISLTKMPLAEDNDVVKALSSDRSDEPLWDRAIPYAHGCKAPNESAAIDAIAITNDIAWWFTPAAGFGQLTGYPLSSRMCGHARP